MVTADKPVQETAAAVLTAQQSQYWMPALPQPRFLSWCRLHSMLLPLRATARDCRRYGVNAK